MKEKIVLLGMSPFSLAIACDFAKNGASVVLWREDIQCESSITITVVESGSESSYEFVETPSFDVVEQATILVASFSGSYDPSLLDAIASHMHKGQIFVLFPGYFLAEEIYARIKKRGEEGIILCEMTSSPCVCELIEPRSLQVFKRKKILKMATLPQKEGPEVLARLKMFLPMLRLAENILETSLENINSILHPLPILLNLVLVARDHKNFRHYIDGIDEHVDTLLHLMDIERINVGKALGLTLDPTLVHLKNFYGDNDATSIYEYIKTPECPYDSIRGYGLESRYITVDIPRLIVPTIRLAQERNIRTPLFDACLSLSQPFLPNGKY